MTFFKEDLVHLLIEEGNFNYKDESLHSPGNISYHLKFSTHEDQLYLMAKSVLETLCDRIL